MPSELDQLMQSLNIGAQNNSAPFGISNVNPTQQSELDKLASSLNFSTDRPHYNTDPNQGPIAPTGVYDLNRDNINIDKEVTNSTLRNAWNSFLRGIDQIQISTAQGKFMYNPLGENSEEIIDNYPQQRKDLDTQLQKGILSPVDYEKESNNLERDYQTALNAKADLDRNVAQNNLEIEQEPVSKDYQYKNYLVNSSGDKGAFWDKVIYSMPQIIGSSASLMVPQMAATFGTNITKSLIQTAATQLAGPEVGIPVQGIGVVGAVAASVAELVWGRAQESYGEVGGNIMDIRTKLTNDYLQAHPQLQGDATKIPEEDQRQIRIQSRKGSGEQFWENMALSVSDAAQALFMPGSKLGALAEEVTSGLGVAKAVKEAGDYNRLTRILRTVGETYYESLGEKFEEGFQQAAQYRATDEALGTKNYTNKGIMADILTDSWDTASSLNYSLIPGITIRPNGKYSQDKEFQFSEDSGGMLGLLMGGIPAAISIGKDLTTYRGVSKRLAKEGVINPDDKITGLQDSILQRVFEKDQVPYLIEAMRSLKGKKDDTGNPIISDTDFANNVRNIREAYNIYESNAERINDLKGDKWLMFNSKDLSNARYLLKNDMFHNAMSTIRGQQDLESKIQDVERIKNQEHVLSGDNPELNNYKTLINQLENVVDTRQLLEQYLNQNLDNIPNVGERNRQSLQLRLEQLKKMETNLQQQIESERVNLDNSNIDYSNIQEVRTELDKANKALINSQLNLSENQQKYNELLKIKNYKQAKAYFDEQSKLRGPAQGSPLNTEEGAEETEPVQRDNTSTESVGNTAGYEDQDTPPGYEEDIPDETQISNSDADGGYFTNGGTDITSPESQVDPTANHVNDTVRDAFRNALDDLDNTNSDNIELDDVNPSLSMGERISRLEQGLANAGLDLSKLKFGDLYRIFRDNFISDPDYIKNKFELLRALSQAYKAERGVSPDELKEIRTVELDPDTLDLIGETKTFNTPPEQTADQSATGNDKVIASANKNQSELETGSGLKITSGLSLATANVISGRTSTGEVGDFRENGIMQFSDQNDQQLVNTNFVSVGDTITIRIDNMPEGFNYNTSDRDSVVINAYKNVKEQGPNGTIEKELLIGSLHTVAKLPELLANNTLVNVQAEQQKLSTIRNLIINSDSKTYTANITNKGFGFLNKNNRQIQISTYQAFGSDQRVHISTVAASGQAIETKDGLIYARGISPMIPGAVVAFIPNEVSNGTLYIPIYLTKNQLKKNDQILNKVTTSVSEYLKTGSRKFMSDAENYVYITSDRQETTGLKGIFYGKKDNIFYINVNGKKYTAKDIPNLKAALGNIYFTANRNSLKNIKGYEEEIMKSGLLTTNIQPNKVLSDRFNTGDYSFLKDGQHGQYFSQHTIVLDNFKESKSNLPTSQSSSNQSSISTNQIDTQQLMKEELDSVFGNQTKLIGSKSLYTITSNYINAIGKIPNETEAKRLMDQYDAIVAKYNSKNNTVNDVKSEISRLRAERVEKAKEMGVAFEGGKGSLKALYDATLAYLSDPEVIADPEGNIEDILLSREFISMYDDYENRIQKLRENSNVTDEQSLTSNGFNGISQVAFNTPSITQDGFDIDGNHWNVITSFDRAKTLINIDGVIVPFYLTTGQGGKGLTPGWYPFFGIGTDGWLNKTNKEDMETYYERYWGKDVAEAIKNIAQKLNSNYGTDPKNFNNDSDPTTKTKPLTSLHEKVENYINSKLPFKPAINDSQARINLRNNIEKLGKNISSTFSLLNNLGSSFTVPDGFGEVKKLWYQGYNTLENRGINYFAASEAEARDYGSNIRIVNVNPTNPLDFYSKEGRDILTQYKKETKKGFDLLDNSDSGLQEQALFFQYIKDRGYDAVQFQDQYLVTLTNSIVTNLTTTEGNAVEGAEITSEENEEVNRELGELGIDLDFDDLVGSVQVEYSDIYKQTLGAQIGLKQTLGARYTDAELESIKQALNVFNKENNVNHQLLSVKIGGQNSIILSLANQTSVDDIDSNSASLASRLLVSKDISATLQNQMVDSIAYMLLNNEKISSTETEKQQEDITNKDKVRKDLEDKLSKFKAMLNKPNTAEILDKLQTLSNNYQLMVDNYEGLYTKALGVLHDLGFEATDENSDYFENLEEHMEDNNTTQFNDDSNSTRNQKNFLPAEVKKLIYFIPNLQLRDLSDPKQAAEMNDQNNPYYGKNYKAKPNSLGLPSFNDFNDTWEKTLSIVSNNTYTSDDSGFNQMLQTLQSESNPIIVQELASRLQKANDQVKNSFFRRTYLQKQQNKTTIITYRNTKGERRETENGTEWVRGTTTKTTQIINSDQRQGIRFVSNQMEQEFRINGLTTGILTTEIEESTGRSINKVNVSFGKELLQSLKNFLEDTNNFVVSREAKGTLKAKASSKFTDSAKASLLELIKQTGINISYGALSDLLRYYRVANSQVTGDERAVAIEVFQNTIFKRLAGLNPNNISNNISSEDEVQGQSDYETNNPFKKDPSTIQSIARYEFAYRVQNQSGSYRVSGKSFYPFTRHSYLSEIFTDMTAWLRDRVRGQAGEKNIFAKLKIDTFAKDSLVLNALANPVANPEFTKTFKFRYALDTKNRSALDSTGKMLPEMTEREHQINKITDFQNSGNRAAVFQYDTLSDKVTMPVIDLLRLDVMYGTENQTIDGGNIVLTGETMNNLYRYFRAEYNRINDVKEQNVTLPKYEQIKGYHGEKGMGQFFNIYYFLNKAVLDVDNPELSNQLYNIDGSLKPLDETLEYNIKGEINKHLNRIFQKTKQDFFNLGLFDLDNKNTRKEFDPLIQDMVDGNYLRKNALKLGLENVKGLYKGDYYKLSKTQLSRIIDYAVVDYVTNYTMFSNEMLMITGDPAQAGKFTDKATIDSIKKKYTDEAQQKKYISIANVAATFVNVGKRNAAFLGSGEKGKFMNSRYSVSIANDMSINSPQFQEYKSLFKGNEAAVEKAYNNGDLTDAQEVTTVEEHLHTMVAFGQITNDQYRKFLYIYDRQHYTNLFPGKSESISAKDRFEAYGIVMQPMKPVQRTYNLDDKLNISKQYYIKTSSYPLVPDMVKGTPLEGLLNDMKDKKVQRVAFVSATKQGVAGAKDIFDKEGNYNEGFLTNNQNELERDGFRIQLEVPYKDYKDAIREGTQLAKLIFVDIPEDLEVAFQGGTSTIGDLKQKYNDYHRAIIDEKTSELLEELGAEIDPTTSLPLITNLSKLAKIIQEEGIDRGYSINALLGLDLNEQGQFKVPLTFLPNTGQIQPVLTAIVSNRIARLKMPGKSYVQGSEFVLNTGKGKVESDLSKVDKRNIVWTKPEYSGISKLKYLREEEGEVKPAQIIMPFYFIDKENHKRVDLRQYTTTDKEGRTILDASKIDPELLEMNGFRIPFQGHNSGMWFEIVGFLPYEMGDLIIVPGEIAAQMGSDYDVDKLYAYMYNYILGKDGNISKVNSTNPDNVEAYQNALIDIHKSIFTSKDMFGPILDPLSFADVEEAIAELGSEESKEFLGAFDPTYQRDTYFSNRGGQLGVGITANANTSHALAQTTNLYIKGQGVVFLDENGIPYSDQASENDKNRVTKYDDNTYKYSVEGKTINQNDGSQRSAWRLDKIFTFTKNPKTGKPWKISNLISQLLGVSVDNAKEQKLGAYGLNKHNFNVAVTIVRSGFDLILTKAFINQPILKEYYDAVGATEDMFTIDFAPNKREQAITDIFKKYGEKFKVDYNSIMNADSVEGFSLNQLKDGLQAGTITEANATQQLQILKAFLHYKTISDGLQSLTSALNIDTKGLPKNVSETINKQDAIENNVADNTLFGNTQNFVSKTIPGLFTNLPTVFEAIFANPKNPLFAYSSVAYVNSQNKIEYLTGRKIVSQDKLDRFHNSIKQFLYTSRNIGKFNNVDDERVRLLFDMGNDTSNNKSLQTRYLELKAKYPQNDLLRAINPIISEYPSDPKLLEIANSSEEDYTERIRQYWEFMLNQSDQTDLKDFADDLVQYSMIVSSQEFGTSNIIKYLPFSALENRGFGDELNRINNNMFQDEELLDSFVYQFIQHESDYTLAAKEKNFKSNSVEHQTISINNGTKTITKDTDIINKFSLDKYNPETLSTNPAASLLREDSDGNWDYPEVLSVFINSKIGKLLYQKKQNSDGTVDYYRIDTLGTNNVSEYDFNAKLGFKKSLIESNRSNAIIPTTQASTNIFQTKPNQTTSDDINLKDRYFPKDNTTVKSLIDTINARLGDLPNNDIVKSYAVLAGAIDKYNINTPIVLNENHTTRATTNWNETDGVTRITFNPSRVFQGDRIGQGTETDGIRTILHELIHALTLDQIESPAYRNSQQYKQLDGVWNEYRDTILNQSKAKLRGINANAFDAELFSLLIDRFKQFRNQQQKESSIYTANLKETLDRVLSDDDILKALLTTLGRKLSTLAFLNKIEKANFDFTSNLDRFKSIKEHVQTFRDNINANTNKYYAYYDIREFVTEAITNPKTQEELKKIPSIWQGIKNALASLLARILGLDKNDRSLLNDAIDSTIDLINLKYQQTEEVNTKQQISTDEYQYYGAKYKIVLDDTGKGIDVVDYKGPNRQKQNLLDRYNNNPDVDPQNGKAFRITDKVQGTQFNLSREYRLPSGKVIRFNDQQYEGLNKIDSWLKSENKHLFTLSGFAGTGKTTIVKAMLDNYSGSVAVTAPTHKAKNVIAKTTKKSAETIQALLGLKPNVNLENFNPNKPEFKKLDSIIPRFAAYSLVVIDEASMLNKALYKEIVTTAKTYGVKVLFMGDPAQIPPVGENISSVFSDVEEKYELTQVERQAGSNPLLSVYDSIRRSISSIKDMFDHKTKINNKGEGIEFTKNLNKFKGEVLRNFLSNEYNSDRNYAKVIAWRNKTIGLWNNIIREGLFGKNAAQYEIGDTIMAYRTFSIPNTNVAIENSSDFIVKNVLPISNHGEYGLDGFKITISDVDEAGTDKTLFVVKRDAINIEKYRTIHNKLVREALANKRLWPMYYNFRALNVIDTDIENGSSDITKDFDYGYALTAHKSQGSTYSHVFVVEDDIDENPNVEERNKIKYVAFSRPTTKVMSLSGKTVDEGINHYIQADDMLNTLPRDVNSVTDSELDELLKYCK